MPQIPEAPIDWAGLLPEFLQPAARWTGRTLTELTRPIAYGVQGYGPDMVTLSDLADIPQSKVGVGLTLAGMLPVGKAIKAGRRVVAPALEAWQVRKADLVPHSATLPRRKAPAETGGGYSEEELNARALRNRASELEPPDITHHEVGSWGVDSTGELMQLREYDLDDPKLIFTEYPSRNQTVQKYVDWLQRGHESPPLSAVETEKGNIKIQEGHHRAAALKDIGRNKAKVWVSVTHNRPIGQGQVMPEGVTHRSAIERAIAAGQTIPQEVLADYLDLISK